ncbi:MAG: symmetrical bis(5'-nucleosyl)-tetraphosphatase [Burkholderiales bacterium]
MATYAIGDVQGCMRELDALLAQCAFDAGRDRLWFVGDLVNRGPASLEVLRFVRDLGERAITVLGNHDLHLLCLAHGAARPRPDDTLEAVLAAPDRDELLGWLRTRRMLHSEDGHVLVHAGLLPQWDLPTAIALAGEVQEALRGPGYAAFLARLYGSEPSAWNDALAGADRTRVVVNAMTRMRFCSDAGVMEFRAKGGVDATPAGYRPWFEVPGRRTATTTVVCGHWSALGLRIAPNLLALDTGCVWGGALSAVRLEDRQLFRVPCAGYQDPIGE